MRSKRAEITLVATLALLSVAIFSAVLLPLQPQIIGSFISEEGVQSCVTPSDNLYINENTTLCSGTYQINDSAADGLIIGNATGIEIVCDGTILIGNNSGIAIKLEKKTYLKNCIIKKYYSAAYIGSETYSEIINNTLTENQYGIECNWGSGYYSKIYNNTLSNNSYGTYLYGCAAYSQIYGNQVANNSNDGLWLYGNYVSVKNNWVYNNRNGIFTYISESGEFSHNIVEHNSQCGISTKGFSSLLDNTLIDNQDGLCLQEYSQSYTIKDSSFINNTRGLSIGNNDYIDILNNTFSGNQYGLYQILPHQEDTALRLSIIHSQAIAMGFTFQLSFRHMVRKIKSIITILIIVLMHIPAM